MPDLLRQNQPDREMEKHYRELEEVKSAMELLKEECRSKSRLAENLKRAHDEQSLRFQESRAEISKQAQEIAAKTEEISVSKQMYQQLESSFREKESALKHLSLANENLRSSFSAKLAKSEEEKSRLVSALDEANANSEEKDCLVVTYKEEITRLKERLSVLEKKFIEAEKKAQASKELTRRDGMLLELEREKGDLEERLKWKSEQFRHLEEAHEKVQCKFRAHEKDWQIERSGLVDEVCCLQTKLDSETRVTEELRSRLRLCNEALAHEESRRKLLEIQISESKRLYENVMSEYEEARLSVASLTAKRDEEIAALRNSLATKAMLVKEMGFKNAHLEEENWEVRSSLKEFREAQINGADTAASLKSLRQKFRALEQAHKGCAEKLKAKEAEWCSEREKLSRELDECLCKLSYKDEQLLELRDEVEGSHSSLMWQKLENEEMFVVLIVLRSKFQEIEDTETETKECTVQVEERVALLMDELEKRKIALVQAQAEIKQEREMLESLQERAEYLESTQQEYFLMQKEVDLYKTGLDDLSRNFDQLKEQAAQKESDFQEYVRKATNELDHVNSDLVERNSELSELEFELQQFRSVVERLEKVNSDLEFGLKKYTEEDLSLRRDLENSLLAKMEAEKALQDGKESFLENIEEQKEKILGLQQQLVDLEEEKKESEACALAKFEKYCEDENKKFLQYVNDMDRRHQNIQAEVDLLKQIYIQRVFESSISLEEEKERLRHSVEEKENVIAEMQRKHLAYEHAFVSKPRDGSAEISELSEALEKRASAYILDCQEIQYRTIMIYELEEELNALQLKMEHDEKLSNDLKQCLSLLEAKSLSDLVEKEKEKINLENELKVLLSNKMVLEVRAADLEASKKVLRNTVLQLSSEREKWVKEIIEFDDLIGKASEEGEELMLNWNMVMQKTTNDYDNSMGFEVEDVCGSKKCDSPSRIKRHNPDRRSPLKEYNC